jgi:DNA-binding CsgD family transcriptional regulator
MDTAELRESGRRSYAAHDWSAAYQSLSALHATGSLDAVGLHDLGLVAGLLGRDEECEQHLAHAFRTGADTGDVATAVRSAFWAALVLGNRGELARAQGWSERARRLVEARPEISASSREHCAVVLMETLLDFREGRLDVPSRFTEIAEQAAALKDPDLEVLAAMGEGAAAVYTGHVESGMRRLDEVMLTVTDTEVHPLAAGLVYCVMLDACRGTLDFRRSAQWTAALSRLCEEQPDMVPYRGQCLVHRVQVMQLRGGWADAAVEAERACAWLSRPPPQPAVGAALYEWAELHRLRGELDQAEAKYKEASRWGHDPQPGLGLLRLTQGRADVAVSGLRRSLAEPHESTVLPVVIAAYVEALLATGDVDTASGAVRDLRATAVEVDVPMVWALTADAEARLALTHGDPAAALRGARSAWTLWHELEAPHQMARSRVVVANACRALGDDDAARMELEAAKSVFEELAAQPDLQEVRRLLAPETGVDPCPLSSREREVIRLIAAGLTNRGIAAELLLSEKTVARHLSNIFVKLDVSTRTAAAAYAFEHGLV